MFTQRVEITWHDAHDCDDGGWVKLDDLHRGPCVMRTVGWLVPDFKPNHVTVAQTDYADDNDEVRHVFSIPLGMVQSIHNLTPAVVELEAVSSRAADVSALSGRVGAPRVRLGNL